MVCMGKQFFTKGNRVHGLLPVTFSSNVNLPFFCSISFELCLHVYASLSVLSTL